MYMGTMACVICIDNVLLGAIHCRYYTRPLCIGNHNMPLALEGVRIERSIKMGSSWVTRVCGGRGQWKAGQTVVLCAWVTYWYWSYSGEVAICNGDEFIHMLRYRMAVFWESNQLCDILGSNWKGWTIF